MSNANPLSPLLSAEAEVTKQINLAESNARAKIQAAEVDADREYNQLKLQEEAKFKKEQEQVGGKGDKSVQETIDRIEIQKKEEQASFDKQQEQVVQLLLHQVTTCAVQLTEQQRQAFLAVQRQKQQQAAADY